MQGAGGVLGRIAMADTMTAGGLAMADKDDVNRLYGEVTTLRGRLDSLAATVTREVAMAQERRPMHDSQIAELKQLAQQNTKDIAEIKGHIRDLTTVVRVVRWGVATVAAGGMAALANVSGAFEAIQQWLDRGK